MTLEIVTRIMPVLIIEQNQGISEKSVIFITVLFILLYFLDFHVCFLETNKQQQKNPTINKDIFKKCLNGKK